MSLLISLYDHPKCRLVTQVRSEESTKSRMATDALRMDAWVSGSRGGACHSGVYRSKQYRSTGPCGPGGPCDIVLLLGLVWDCRGVGAAR